MLHPYVVEPKTKCCTLMCVNQWPNDTVWCGIPLSSGGIPIFFVQTVFQRSSAVQLVWCVSQVNQSYRNNIEFLMKALEMPTHMPPMCNIWLALFLYHFWDRVEHLEVLELPIVVLLVSSCSRISTFSFTIVFLAYTWVALF